MVYFHKFFKVEKCSAKAVLNFFKNLHKRWSFKTLKLLTKNLTFLKPVVATNAVSCPPSTLLYLRVRFELATQLNGLNTEILIYLFEYFIKILLKYITLGDYANKSPRIYTNYDDNCLLITIRLYHRTRFLIH